MNDNTILIVGGNGNMGKRYKACLNYYGKPYVSVDIDNYTDLDILKKSCTNILICTPTDTHLDIIKEVAFPGKNILCEKPLSTNMIEVDKILGLSQKRAFNLKMVNNYDYIAGRINYNQLPMTITSYDYFKTGLDGLAWDCIQIIRKAKGEIKLRNNSPVWRCYINGVELDYSDIDNSYIRMMSAFYENKLGIDNVDELHDLHVKTNDIQNEINKDKTYIYWDTSTKQ